MTGLDLVRLPGQYFPSLRDSATGTDEPLEKVFAREGRNAQFERFFERCRRELPADARVLYVGRTEGQLLAYILYPRPVFMHPTDRYVAWIGHQVLDLGRPLPYDELFPGGCLPRSRSRASTPSSSPAGSRTRCGSSSRTSRPAASGTIR